MTLYPRYCEICGNAYAPIRQQQKYCQSDACLAQARRLWQQTWLEKNPGYFRGPVHVIRVDQYRKTHPNYRRGDNARRRRQRVLQEGVHTQVRILHEVFVGGTGVVLQEAVAPRLRALLHMGQLMQAETADESGDADAAASAVNACEPIRTVGVLFVDRHNLPGVFFQEQTFRCVGALLKVLPR